MKKFDKEFDIQLILQTVKELEERGLIKLYGKSTRSIVFTEFVRNTKFSMWFIFTLATIVGTIVSVYVLPVGSPFVPFRYLLSGVYLFYLPGLGLTRLLFPSNRDLEGVERIVLAFGLSIAFVIGTGLLLNATSYGIRLNTIILVSLLGIISFAIAGEYRTYMATKAEG